MKTYRKATSRNYIFATPLFREGYTVKSADNFTSMIEPTPLHHPAQAQQPRGPQPAQPLGHKPPPTIDTRFILPGTLDTLLAENRRIIPD